MTAATPVYLLHGFLGNKDDWSDTARELCGWDLRAIDLVDEARPDGDSLAGWAMRFNDRVASEAPDGALLVGYSLGGRLALHALLDRPGLWRGAVLISAHAGLDEEPDRAARVVSDEIWARRWRHEPWNDVLSSWNAQPMFGSAKPPGRPEPTYRAAIAAALIDWSLGRQLPLWNELSRLSMPLLWVAGAMDSRFAGLAERGARSSGNGSLSIIEGAGHRVPLEAPERLGRVLRRFFVEVIDGNLDFNEELRGHPPRAHA